MDFSKMKVIIASLEESKLEKNYFRIKSIRSVEYFTIFGKYTQIFRTRLFWFTIVHFLPLQYRAQP